MWHSSHLSLANAVVETMVEDFVLTARRQRVGRRVVIVAPRAAQRAVTHRDGGISLCGHDPGRGHSGGNGVLLARHGTVDLQLCWNSGTTQYWKAASLLFAIAVIATNFFADLLYHALDPRVRRT